jgi:hypothetical protein
MPRDVSTRWNSTFDMLEYAIEHREAIDIVTQRRDLGLRKFELIDDEWMIVEQLRDVLKVRSNQVRMHPANNTNNVVNYLLV